MAQARRLRREICASNVIRARDSHGVDAENDCRNNEARAPAITRMSVDSCSRRLGLGVSTSWLAVALCACSGSAGDSSGPINGAPTVPASQAPGAGTAGPAGSLTPGPGAGSAGPVGAPSTGVPGAPTVEGTTGTPPSATAPTTPPPVTAAADNGLPGRSLIRRLSNAEYAATIERLFGDSTDYTAEFPTDTVVNGFTNNTDVQDVAPALVEQYVSAAEAISANAVSDTDSLLGCQLSAGDACVADFIERFGKRAWRRPLTGEEQTELLSVYQGEADPTAGVRVLIQAFLNSPSFLYRAEVGVPVPGQTYAALTSWEMATRLSYFLTGTMPDEELFAAAEADSLTTAEGVEAQARRLLQLPEARENVADFFSGWLNLHALERLQRDTEEFANWDSQLPPLFYEETREFATNVIFDGEGDFTTLMTAPFTYGDPALAEFYGGTAGPVENGVARIELPPDQRAGLLTQASFLATHAKEIQTDPVSRGKFVRERMLCQGIPAPPPDLKVTAPTITPGSTTRQRFVQHQEDPVCASCHVLIDPVGLAFEHYDAIGQWRDQEQGLDIDASGDLTNTDVSGPFNGVVEMAGKLVQSELATECFVRYWFRFAFGRGESDSEAPRLATITGDFKAADQQVRELLVELALTPDFRYLAKDESTQ